MKLREQMPAFTGGTEWVNGEVTNEQLKGSPTLVHFWSISCEMCKAALPDINEWREKYKEQNLKVVGVHMPRSEKDTEIDSVKEAIVKYELTHPVVIDNKHAIVEAFENQYVPAYYLFDEEGQLRHFQAGEKGLPMLKKRLHRILGVEE